MADETITQSTSSVDAPISLDPVPTISEGTPAKAEAQIQQDEQKAPATEAAPETKTEEVKAETEAKAEDVPETKPEETEEELDRFDKHPRFQELNKKAKDAEARAIKLEAQLELLNKQVGELKKVDAPKDDPLNDEELTQLFDENPAAALKKVMDLARQQAKDEVLGELNEKQSFSVKEKLLKDFQEKNPDFIDLWNDGTLQQFVDANPIHNPMSAYLLHTMPAKIEAEVAKAVEAAKAEVKADYEAKIKEIEANHKAKKEIKVITDSPESPTSTNTSEDEIRNSKSGTVNILTGIVQKMRQAAT